MVGEYGVRNLTSRPIIYIMNRRPATGSMQAFTFIIAAPSLRGLDIKYKEALVQLSQANRKGHRFFGAVISAITTVAIIKGEEA